jgi:hypothetical protein
MTHASEGSPVQNSTTYSIVARCLLEPEFLDHVSRDPLHALGEYQLAAGLREEFLALDTAKVRSFAGFITKVRHNFLWESFRYSRSLLQFYKNEIEIFTAYVPLYQRLTDSPATRNEKIARFAEFLLEYLDSEAQTTCPGLRETVEHERLLWEIKTALASYPEPSETGLTHDCIVSPSDPIGKVIPFVRGLLRVASFRHDPFEIISLLARGEFAGDRLTQRGRLLTYWGDTSAQELRVLELDQLSVAFLLQVDGKRTIQTIIRRIRAGSPFHIKMSQARSFFMTAFERRLLGGYR